MMEGEELILRLTASVLRSVHDRVCSELEWRNDFRRRLFDIATEREK